MASAAFFGNGSFYYENYRDKIKEIVIDLIENRSVTEFYNGCRGDFDTICAETVGEVMREYPQVKNYRVLSYHPRADFILSKNFTESVYLIEKPVPPRFAILYTNRLIVDKVDIIVSGVYFAFGGAQKAYEYAVRKKKEIIDIFGTKTKI